MREAMLSSVSVAEIVISLATPAPTAMVNLPSAPTAVFESATVNDFE